MKSDYNKVRLGLNHILLSSISPVYSFFKNCKLGMEMTISAEMVEVQDQGPGGG